MQCYELQSSQFRHGYQWRFRQARNGNAQLSIQMKKSKCNKTLNLQDLHNLVKTFLSNKSPQQRIELPSLHNYRQDTSFLLSLDDLYRGIQKCFYVDPELTAEVHTYEKCCKGKLNGQSKSQSKTVLKANAEKVKVRPLNNGKPLQQINSTPPINRKTQIADQDYNPTKRQSTHQKQGLSLGEKYNALRNTNFSQKDIEISGERNISIPKRHQKVAKEPNMMGLRKKRVRIQNVSNDLPGDSPERTKRYKNPNSMRSPKMKRWQNVNRSKTEKDIGTLNNKFTKMKPMKPKSMKTDKASIRQIGNLSEPGDSLNKIDVVTRNKRFQKKRKYKAENRRKGSRRGSHKPDNFPKRNSRQHKTFQKKRPARSTVPLEGKTQHKSDGKGLVSHTPDNLSKETGTETLHNQKKLSLTSKWSIEDKSQRKKSIRVLYSHRTKDHLEKTALKAQNDQANDENQSGFTTPSGGEQRQVKSILFSKETELATQKNMSMKERPSSSIVASQDEGQTKSGKVLLFRKSKSTSEQSETEGENNKLKWQSTSTAPSNEEKRQRKSGKDLLSRKSNTTSQQSKIGEKKIGNHKLKQKRSIVAQTKTNFSKYDQNFPQSHNFGRLLTTNSIFTKPDWKMKPRDTQKKEAADFGMVATKKQDSLKPLSFFLGHKESLGNDLSSLSMLRYPSHQTIFKKSRNKSILNSFMDTPATSIESESDMEESAFPFPHRKKKQKVLPKKESIQNVVKKYSQRSLHSSVFFKSDLAMKNLVYNPEEMHIKIRNIITSLVSAFRELNLMENIEKMISCTEFERKTSKNLIVKKKLKKMHKLLKLENDKWIYHKGYLNPNKNCKSSDFIETEQKEQQQKYYEYCELCNLMLWRKRQQDTPLIREMRTKQRKMELLAYCAKKALGHKNSQIPQNRLCQYSCG